LSNQKKRANGKGISKRLAELESSKRSTRVRERYEEGNLPLLYLYS